ncbi:hypothetical protein [Nannocystis sp. SCPEA4]|uniref:hypothetical protein n=1 Tax=Nannocystis sp. SCPEA4 TaxID=2996787 RepID=UPI00226D52A0|nr:hypothetical protein [Nannocystis sp. SCPEA4]MCY1062366.1 hypothetical protein [Nannocystis sp. SCPEA4]
MIDYAVLCRAIEDWKAGNAPNIPAPSRPVPVAAETVVDSYDAVDEAAEDVVESDAGDVDDAGDVGDVDTGDEEGEVEVAAEQQQDRTIVYQLPDIEEGEEEEQA